MDYILFVHGVNTREQREKPAYADDLIRRINHTEATGEPSASATRGEAAMEEFHSPW